VKVEHPPYGGRETFATKQGRERHIRSPKDYFEMPSNTFGQRIDAMSITELRDKVRSMLDKQSDEAVLLCICGILEQASHEDRLSEVMTARVAKAQAEYKAGLGIPAEEILRRIRQEMLR
jgi:hypothetical protein